MIGKETWARRKAAGLCPECGRQPPLAGKARCGECLERARLQAAKKRGRASSYPGLRKRKCHDCGAPTVDYRCAKCLAEWRRKNGVAIDPESGGFDTYGFAYGG